MQPSIFELVGKYGELKEANPSLYEKVHAGVNTICESFKTYGVDSVAISYNGGKDSDVCLQLWRLSLYVYLDQLGRLAEYQESVDNGLCVTFQCADDFEEINNHVCSVITDIGMDLFRSVHSFKQGMQKVIDVFHTQAIILGVRRTDPQGAGLTPLTPSSSGFPPFMRVLPILEWTYGDVWDFLLFFGIPYCSLYRSGFLLPFLLICRYTSIGTKRNTFRNRLLQKEDGSFDHASKLSDWSAERARD